MSVRSLAEIMEEMRKRYKRYPELCRKWRVLAGSDEYGFSDLFFYAPKLGVWQIKGDLKSPYELVGAGARVSARKVDDEIRKLMEKGTPMPFGLISPHPELKDRAIIAAGLGRYQETTKQLKEHLTSRERRVDAELRKRIEKLRHELGLDIAYL
ncbi:MAG TPA: hypothetical protein EYP46_01315 [Hadesarchaea archaeon]|nr:hypothetical protein [Hadesarchaea archaeon]